MTMLGSTVQRPPSPLGVVTPDQVCNLLISCCCLNPQPSTSEMLTREIQITSECLSDVNCVRSQQCVMQVLCCALNFAKNA